MGYNLPPIEIPSEQEQAEQLLVGDVWILFAQSPQLQTNLKEGGQLNIFSNFELSVTGVNKKPFAFPFQDRQFQNPVDSFRNVDL